MMTKGYVVNIIMYEDVNMGWGSKRVIKAVCETEEETEAFIEQYEKENPKRCTMVYSEPTKEGRVYEWEVTTFGMDNE